MLQGFLACASRITRPYFSEENPGHTLKTGRNEMGKSRGDIYTLKYDDDDDDDEHHHHLLLLLLLLL
jgi:hypothetical protein